MDDTDRIVAAIFTAGLCQGKADAAEYFRLYDRCLEMINERKKAADAAKKAEKKPQMKISEKAMAWASKKPGK